MRFTTFLHHLSSWSKKKTSSLPRSLVLIIILAFSIRLLLLGTLLWKSGERSLFLPDSTNFYQTATNIISGHGFSRETSAPYLPGAHFPPLYPLMLSGSLAYFGSVIPVIVLQIILSSLLPLLIWKIGGFFINSKTSLLLASGLAAFEPLMILWSVLILTDVPATFLMLAGLLFYLKILLKPSYKNSVWAALFLALSVLVRPHAQFIFYLATLILVFLAISRFFTSKIDVFKNLGHKKIIGIIAMFVVVFYVTMSPWLIRNKIHFDTFNISTTGLRNIYVTLAPSVLSVKTGRAYDEEKNILIKDFANRHGVTTKDIFENPALGKDLFREGLDILKRNPGPTLKVLIIDSFAFFTQDLYLTYLRQFNVIPRFTLDFSPTFVLFTEGLLTVLQMGWNKLGLFALIPLFGRALWVAITLSAVFGFATLIKKGGQERVLGILAALVIFYYASTSMAAGFSDYGRHRYPANAFIFMLAGYFISRFALTKQSDHHQ